MAVRVLPHELQCGSTEVTALLKRPDQLVCADRDVRTHSDCGPDHRYVPQPDAFAVPGWIPGERGTSCRGSKGPICSDHASMLP